MPCFEAAKWQREEFPDHKFDYINVDDFIDESWVTKLKYSMIFFLTLKSVAVYTADVSILVLLIQGGVLNPSFDCSKYNNPTSTVSATGVTAIICGSSNSSNVTKELAPVAIRPWVLLASIIMSFLLLLWDYRKGWLIVQSKDIARSLTNHVTYRYYVLKSYPHYCFFAEILNARTNVDKFAFFIYFTFKTWKRLFLAEFPRIYIYAMNMYDLLHSYIPPAQKYSNPIVQFTYAIVNVGQLRQSDPIGVATFTLSLFSLSIWFISFCAIVVAFFAYFPLLYMIRGNLKEYVCHKIDKRITEILKKKTRERTQEARQAELAELERTKQIKSRMEAQGVDTNAIIFKPAPPLGLNARPTLPTIDVDIDNDDTNSGYDMSVYEGTVGVGTVQYVNAPQMPVGMFNGGYQLLQPQTPPGGAQSPGPYYSGNTSSGSGPSFANGSSAGGTQYATRNVTMQSSASGFSSYSAGSQKPLTGPPPSGPPSTLAQVSVPFGSFNPQYQQQQQQQYQQQQQQPQHFGANRYAPGFLPQGSPQPPQSGSPLPQQQYRGGWSDSRSASSGNGGH
ncbi:hypothetical protein HK100_002799 [Physocladia obscura]|uniref:Uncharacterized protein n=1 Tax=Physocladia obscura TaxID=109957 RepID=A0AAD5SXT1_9FUNG|nr:hypothetical protein HK100_002799 [Physocladia obscura]